MASTYTTNLRLTKQADGENPNSWGQILNDGVISLADQAIAGLATITMVSASTAVTLTGNDGASDQSRNAFLKISGSAANAHQLIIPANSKSYAVLNTASGTGVVLMKTAAGTGVTIERNSTKFQHVVCDGTSVRSSNLLNNTVCITDNLFVGNNTNIGGTCTIAGAVQLNSAVCISGAANFSSTVTVVGAATFKSNVSIGGTLTGVETTPSGAVTAFAGTSLPSGWLYCFGQNVSRTTYADLFSAVGTTYGVGDGSSTFGIPDLRGRAIAGQDDMGGSSANRLTGQTGGVNGDTLGAGGGAETHVITEAQLAAHAHLIAADAEGSDTYPTASNYIAKKGVWGSNNNYQFSGTATTPTLGLTTSVGDDTAHNNVQPTFILNYIIKT
jgi:microcystin-dependent protein